MSKLTNINENDFKIKEKLNEVKTNFKSENKI
jgi:hypothetical protein